MSNNLDPGVSSPPRGSRRPFPWFPGALAPSWEWGRSPSWPSPPQPRRPLASASQILRDQPGSGSRFPYDLDSGLTTQTSGQSRRSLYLTLRRRESWSLKIEDISLSGPVLRFFFQPFSWLLPHRYPNLIDLYSQRRQICQVFWAKDARRGEFSGS